MAFQNVVLFNNTVMENIRVGRKNATDENSSTLSGGECQRLSIDHRMRNVENADQILVLDGGVVAESGTHAELMQKDGLYARLVKLQTEAAEWKLNANGGNA